MTFLFGGQFGAAVLAIALCTPAIADEVLFENVRIFDGKSAVLSAPSKLLVKGNVIETISEAPIGAEGVTRIAGAGRTLMPGLIDMHWHAMLVRPNPVQAISGDLGYTISWRGPRPRPR